MKRGMDKQIDEASVVDSEILYALHQFRAGLPDRDQDLALSLQHFKRLSLDRTSYRVSSLPVGRIYKRHV